MGEASRWVWAWFLCFLWYRCLAFSLCFLYIYECLPACMYCTTCVPDAPRNQKKGENSPRPGDTDSCEMPAGCWELNSDCLQEQEILLTAQSFFSAPQVILKDCFKIMCLWVGVHWEQQHQICQVLWAVQCGCCKANCVLPQEWYEILRWSIFQPHKNVFSYTLKNIFKI